MQIQFIRTPRTDNRLLCRMRTHYSHPKGFVGRNLCYAINHNDIYYGHIVAGSATRHLPGRHDYLGTNPSQLNNIVNNIFFNISPKKTGYPLRNFTTLVIEEWVNLVVNDWFTAYGDRVLGFETLIEKPRTGELYRRAGWELVGETKGYTCKRIAGKGSDSWSGKRVWNTSPDQLRPKLVLCYRVRD